MAGFIDSTEVGVPYLDGKYYQAKLNGRKVFPEGEDPYPPYYKDERDILLFVRADSEEGVSNYFVRLPFGAVSYDPGKSYINGYSVYHTYAIYWYKLSDPENTLEELSISFNTQYSELSGSDWASQGYDFQIEPDTDYIFGIAPTGTTSVSRYGNGRWACYFGTMPAFMAAGGTNVSRIKNIRRILNFPCAEAIYNIGLYSKTTAGFLQGRFANWTNLEKFVDHSDDPIYTTTTIKANGDVDTGADYIMYETFSNCTKLTRVRMPMIIPYSTKDALGIGFFGRYCFTRTFYHCTSLKETVADLVPEPTSQYPVEVVMDQYQASMYEGCTSLTKVNDYMSEPIAPYKLPWYQRSYTYSNNTQTYTYTYTNCNALHKRKYLDTNITSPETEYNGTLLFCKESTDTYFVLSDFKESMYAGCLKLTHAPAECKIGGYNGTTLSLQYFRNMQFANDTLLRNHRGFGCLEDPDDLTTIAVVGTQHRAWQFDNCTKFTGSGVVLQAFETKVLEDNVYDSTRPKILMEFAGIDGQSGWTYIFGDVIQVRKNGEDVHPKRLVRSGNSQIYGSTYPGNRMFYKREFPDYNLLNRQYRDGQL